jgi:hypothetical protein
MPRCETEAMNLHLAEIATQIAPGAHAALLVDQAGWHPSDRLIVPAKHHSDPVAGEMSGTEPAGNIWQFMRDNRLSNRIFKSVDDIVDHCCTDTEQARRSTLADHVHRPAGLGLWVTITEAR